MSLRFLLAAVLIATAVAGPVAAQDAANNSTSTNTTTASEGKAAQNVSVQVGPTLQIVRWEFDSGTWEITVRSDVPERLTLTDSGAMFRALSEGSGARAASIPTRSYTLDAGTTTLQFGGETVDGQAAVSIAANDQLVLLRTGAMETSRPAVPWSTVQLLLVGTAVSVGAVATVLVHRRRDQEDVEFERCT